MFGQPRHSRPLGGEEMPRTVTTTLPVGGTVLPPEPPSSRFRPKAINGIHDQRDVHRGRIGIKRGEFTCRNPREGNRKILTVEMS